MNPNSKHATGPAHEPSGADDLPDEVLRVSIDELVPFLNDFFAAMDALRGPGPTPGDTPLPGSPGA